MGQDKKATWPGLHPKHRPNLLSSSGSPIFAQMAELLNSILNVTKVFQKYAQENGDCASLCKKELKQLLYAEFRDILRVRQQTPGSRDSDVNDSNTCIQGLAFYFIWSHSTPITEEFKADP